MTNLIPIKEVPCRGCVRCCIGDAIRLLPGDNPADFQTVPHPYFPGSLMLDHKPDGACVYLAESGCSIHDKKPTQCRTMDCRNIAKAISATQARKMAKQNQLKLAVWEKGRELLRNNKKR